MEPSMYVFSNVIKAINVVLESEMLRISTESRLRNDLLLNIEEFLKYVEDEANLSLNNEPAENEDMIMIERVLEIAQNNADLYPKAHRWQAVVKTLEDLCGGYSDARRLMCEVGEGDILEVQNTFIYGHMVKVQLVKGVLVKAISKKHNKLIVKWLGYDSIEVSPYNVKLIAVGVE